MGEVKAIDSYINNSELIAACARLGYLGKGWSVFDATYGLGNFWNDFRPDGLVTNDMFRPADYGYDFRCLPFRSGVFDAVVFDPPYRLSGTPSGDIDTRYGTDKLQTRKERLDAILAGAVECWRLVRKKGFLLVKCQDQVNGGKVHWMTMMLANELGMENLVDMLFLVGGRPQPEGRSQVRARRNYSNLMVFQSK